MTTGEAPAVDLAVTYDIDGPPDAPAVVFVHGTRLSRAMWTPQLTGLADTYRVIAVDLPGHGALASRPFTLDGAADHLASVIESAANGGRAVVVGLSLGGYVAMHLAARHPERVRGLVLTGATAEPDAWRRPAVRALAWALGRFDGRRLDDLNAWFFRRRFPVEHAEPIIAGGFWSSGGAAALRAITGERFVPRLAAYPGPTLVLNGTWDVVFRLSAPTFSRAGRDVRRVRLAGAAHLANLERPEAYNAAVRAFLQGLGTAD